MNQRRCMTFCSLVLLAGVAVAQVGCDSGEEASATPTSRGAMKVSRALVVETVPAERGPFTVLADYAGEFVAERQADVAFEVQGRVNVLELDVGDEVAEGDVLAEIDATRYRQAEREGAAALAMATAQVGEAEVAVENVEDELARKQPLREGDVISAREIAQLEAQVRQARQQLSVARAQREQAVARLQTARENLRHRQVRAPFEGKIARRHVDLGTFVNTSQPVMRVVSDEVYLTIDVPESGAGALVVGQEAAVRLTAAGGRKLSGRVVRVAPAFDPATRTLRADISVDLGAEGESGELVLRPGMYATVQLSLGDKPDALTLPRQAILRERDGAPYVWAVVDGKAQRRELRLGLRGRERAEVIEGLEAGTEVVLRGFDKLKPGVEVEPLADDVGAGRAAGQGGTP